jgi:hypothetical protein
LGSKSTHPTTREPLKISVGTKAFSNGVVPLLSASIVATPDKWRRNHGMKLTEEKWTHQRRWWYYYHISVESLGYTYTV